MTTASISVRVRVLAAYLAFTGVLFGITASQVTWGGPNWWPVAVGAASLACVCAVGFALLQDAGEQVGAGCHADLCGSAPGTPLYLAFKRFAALPAVTRHVWLAAHLPALRAGDITLAELP